MTPRGLWRVVAKPLSESGHTYASYRAHVRALADRYRVVTVGELAQLGRDAEASLKPTVAIRHDIDVDLPSALEMASIEQSIGVSSTYYVLHTAAYYGRLSTGLFVRDESVVDTLLQIQAMGHEVGWHNDLVTLQVVFGFDALSWAQSELTFLRDAGLSMRGTAAHGSDWCEKLGYDNRFIFTDVHAPWLEKRFPNTESVQVNGERRMIPKVTLSGLGFAYEAYHVAATQSFSDVDRPGETRWHPRLLPELAQNERVVVLTHPVHWGRSAWQKYQRSLTRLVRRHAQPFRT